MSPHPLWPCRAGSLPLDAVTAGFLWGCCVLVSRSTLLCWRTFLDEFRVKNGKETSIFNFVLSKISDKINQCVALQIYKQAIVP